MHTSPKKKAKGVLAPSILNANFTNIEEEIELLVRAGVKWIHLDIMDGNFVPNITFGPSITKQIIELTQQNHWDLFFDAHLMTENPTFWAERFVEVGCNLITIHAEATHHLDRAVEYVKSLGVQVGVALNPSTPLENVEFVLPKVDLLLVMTVNPGFGGQSFIDIPTMYEKITRARKLCDKWECKLQVDGGVKLSNIGMLKQLGVDVFVVGSEIFASEDKQEKIRLLCKEIC